MENLLTSTPETQALVVDDEKTVRFILRQILEREGCTVLEAADGAQAVAIFETAHPDLILLDCMMPVMDGFSACAKIRALPQGDRVPILMITALTDEASIDKAYQAGATDYITKPVRIEMFRRRVRNALRAKLLEDDLIRGKKEWEATFDSVSDMILLTSVEGRIIRCNRAAARRFQATYNDLIGRDIETLLLGEAAHDAVPLFAQAGQTQISIKGAWFETRVYPMHVEGSLYGMVYVVEDITERKQMLSQMMAAQKLADLGTLAAGVAHEINSPLQVITGMCDSVLLRLEQAVAEPESLRRRLETIKRSGWRCAEIAHALLTYSRPSTAQVRPDDLNAVVRDSLLLIEHQLRSWSNITVVTELEPNLPPLVCDPNQITQVLINLLTNARDAMPDGGEIVLRTCHDPETDRLCLQVSDNGIGIPESARSRIFDPFFTTKPVDKGTGLGLSIVTGIVQAHGGEIELESAEGQGTTFIVRFPASAPTPAFDETLGQALPPAKGQYQEVYS